MKVGSYGNTMKPLKIKSLAMHSCLAKGAELNASAMRCEYDGFTETSFTQPHSIEPQLGAMVDIEERGLDKLTRLALDVIKEAVEGKDIDLNRLPIYFCLQDLTDRPSYFSDEELKEEFIEDIARGLDIKRVAKETKIYLYDRCGFVMALKQAQIDIYDNRHKDVLIVGVDSLLNGASLAYYGGGLYGEGNRLLSDNSSNGFIPAEASTAILLSKPTDIEDEIIIGGIGLAKEKATIYNEDEVLRGIGLSQAIMEASKEASVPIHETGFRVSSISGEEYFFSETALAHIKTLKQKVPEHPLWHPADCIGEVGSAMGGAMVVMTYYAFIKGYAPSNSAICQISNDNELRGAFIMQYKKVD